MKTFQVAFGGRTDTSIRCNPGPVCFLSWIFETAVFVA